MVVAGVRNRSVIDVVTGKNLGTPSERGYTPPEVGGSIGDRVNDLVAAGAGLVESPNARDGLVYIDGKPVAAWIARELLWARRNGWSGTVSSGYRSFREQWEIYYVRGIRPAAVPGTSNHEGKYYPRGAVDVTQWDQLRAVLRRYPGGSRLKWYGPGDAVHFSATGR